VSTHPATARLTAIKALQAPLPPARLALATILIAAAVVAYCLAYTAYSGRRESVGEALVWTLVNVLPWVAAFEAAKRAASLPSKAAVLAAAGALSLGLGLLAGEWSGFAFEAVRRLPWLAACALLLALGAYRAPTEEGDAALVATLPAFLERTEWISSAGNYVELHAPDRTLIHRSSLSSVEARLARDGFVRIHRCTLVRRNCIERVRGEDVVLKSGRILKTGKRYRSALGATDFVPSSQSSGRGREAPDSRPS